LVAHRVDAVDGVGSSSARASVLLIAEASHPLTPLLLERLRAEGRACMCYGRPKQGEEASWPPESHGSEPPDVMILPPAAEFGADVRQQAGDEGQGLAGRASERVAEVIAIAELAAKTWPQARLWIVTRGAWANALDAATVATEGALW